MLKNLISKILLVLSFFLWFDNAASAQENSGKTAATVQTATPPELDDQTKQEMVHFVVTDFFSRLKNNKIEPNNIDKCVFVLSGKKTSVIFSLRNIDQEIFPEIEDYKFTFLSDDEIYSQASIEKPVCYLAISTINIVKNEAWISIRRYFQKPHYTFANIFSYKFKKAKGKWVGKYVTMKTFES